MKVISLHILFLEPNQPWKRFHILHFLQYFTEAERVQSISYNYCWTEKSMNAEIGSTIYSTTKNPLQPLKNKYSIFLRKNSFSQHLINLQTSSAVFDLLQQAHPSNFSIRHALIIFWWLVFPSLSISNNL